ncbi:1-deoxy-D-xylulose-5-phosphate reductoisomerase [Denitrobacterium detoxificans]|jgi:1-deoxy-D-xylulose-5-phosphate reductoisomerase|uniref:1-deoxy-D-xylulose-5-phosphate reductoisomerase n=1 Tax=Denitrobacterium detoxificans TaxID=79604 RepID=UPI0026F2D3E1|nr:1-deoxy-D-xylulose-5-phosphate reductoisomerase [Denitrobacterium detoxificans]MBE6465628.1 1-deoxy-D-xylulose-5-phosphate reductoisomerase [Denitrobacterium detoxificans]
MSQCKRIAVLGSTGSIGVQTLDVARQHASELQVVALACGRRVDTMIEQARACGATYVACGLEEAPEVTADLTGLDYAVGMDAVVSLVRLPEVDIVVNALVGAAGLRASYETLRAGKVLALANKESLVVGGDLIMPLAAQVDAQRRASGVAPAVGPAGALMPIDSEHGAIYQCLLGEERKEVSCLWVTASGGPFRGRTRSELSDITPAQALAHPTWNMGPKITIDSSTLMNKGLEVIEAHHLFNMPYDRIKVVVQPQSAIHSMVEFTDGSVKAHLGTTDMRIPIQFALSYPKRWEAPVEPLDFTKLGSLEFYPADTKTFRCLELARMAGTAGGTLPCAMNAANEVAVASFLAGECSYLGIAETVERVMDAHVNAAVESLEQLAAVDAASREAARGFIAVQ